MKSLQLITCVVFIQNSLRAWLPTGKRMIMFHIIDFHVLCVTCLGCFAVLLIKL